MTGYLQRLLDRSAPAPAPSGAPGDAPIAHPAMPSRSPIAAADQRLHDPHLAAVIGTAPPPQGDDIGLFSPEPEAGDHASGYPAAETTGYTERSVRRASRIRDRRESESHSTPAPKSGREAPQSPSEPLPPPSQRLASPSVDEPNSEPATPPPFAPLPAEHPLRRLDVDIIRPPAEAPPISDRTPTTSPETAPDPAISPVPDLRFVEDPDNRPPDVTAPRPDHPASTELTEAARPETVQHRTAEAEPRTVEPAPLPAPPPPPPSEPETIVIEKTEPTAQAAPTEQPKPETVPPETAERPRPGPKTAAAASLIGPLPQRIRVRTLFGVRRR